MSNELLRTWAAHIAQRYRFNRQEFMDGKLQLEILHTCHGCGLGPRDLHEGGLCQECREQLQEVLK